MKRTTLLVIALVMSAGVNSNAWAQEEFGTVHRTMVVHPVPTNPKLAGMELLTAMAHITNASATNPWLIKLDAGVYDLGSTTLAMRPYVDIEGSGEDVTKITAAGLGYNTGTVNGTSNAELRFLTIENTGGPFDAIAVTVEGASPFATGPSPKLTHVTLTSSGGTSLTIGMVAFFSSAQLTDVTVNMPGGGIGLRLGGGETLRHVTVTVSSGPAAYAIGADLDLSVAGSGRVTTMNDVTIVAPDAALLEELFAIATVDRSTLKGGQNSVRLVGQTSLAIGASNLAGPAANGGGLLTCVGVYNASYVWLNSSCQ
jgi:hypothetical protein